MIRLTAFLLLQVSLPGPGMPYDARVDYQGPGLVCGAAFSFPLKRGESATLIKSSPINWDLTIRTKGGPFSVRESQYATRGGKPIREVSNGVLSQLRNTGGYVWVYTDNTPGSTDIYGPAVNAAKPTAAFKRMIFGGPRSGMVGNHKCLDGSGSDPQVS